MAEKIGTRENDVLLLVEPQVGFTREHGSFHINGAEAVGVMNKAMEKIPWAVITADAHPKDHISFKKWGEHCVPGTYDSELDPELNRGPIKAIFMKGTGKNEDIYDSFLIPGLKEYLTAIKAERLFVAGSAIPVCPSDTAISGVKEGFEVYLIWDACCIIPGTDEQVERNRLKKSGIKVINYEDLE